MLSAQISIKTTIIPKNFKHFNKKMAEKIEKPWAIYKDIMAVLSGVGKVIKEKWLEIQYAERQLYSPAVWDEKYVQRFGFTIEKDDAYPFTDVFGETNANFGPVTYSKNNVKIKVYF